MAEVGRALAIADKTYKTNGAMRAQTDRPVTVKCRIGIDDMDPETGLDRIVDAVADAGVQVIYLSGRNLSVAMLMRHKNLSLMSGLRFSALLVRQLLDGNCVHYWQRKTWPRKSAPAPPSIVDYGRAERLARRQCH